MVVDRAERSVLFVSVLLLVVALSAGTGTVAAQSTSDCSTVTYNGAGTDANPYEVGSVDQLRCVNERGLDSSYEAVSDIDASDKEGFEPIGDEDDPFTGTFDGNGHTVSGLTVNRTDEENVGPFGYVGSGGTVTNLNVEDADITGGDSVGGIAGYNEGTVRRSHAAGNVEGTGGVGGLVGRNLGVVTESHTSAEVSGEDNVGGIVGRNAGVGEVSESYATGSATGGTVVGGAVGSNGDDITDSYAMADVEGESTLGGLVGANVGGSVRRTYSTGTVSGARESGGFVGLNNGEVFGSYWDRETANQAGSSAGVPLSTAEMTGANAPRNMELEFGETWVRREEGYPALVWEVRGTQTASEEEDETPLPGFGGIVAVAALLVGGGILRRRKERRR